MKKINIIFLLLRSAIITPRPGKCCPQHLYLRDRGGLATELLMADVGLGWSAPLMGLGLDTGFWLYRKIH